MTAALQGCALQGSLWDVGEEAGLRDLGSAVRRTVLSRGAWVDLRPGWATGSDALFARLTEVVPWHAERRQMYDRVVDVPRLLQLLRRGRAAARPAARARPATPSPATTPPSSASRSSPPGCASTATAATASPGTATRSAAAAPRTPWSRSSRSARPGALLLRPRGGGAALRHQLGHGDLLVMGGSCQRTWEHAIPKTARPVGPRISVQFRTRGVR